MKNFKQTISRFYYQSLAALLLFAWPLASRAQSYNFENESGLEKTADAAGYTAAWKIWTPEGLATNVLTQVLTWLGVVFLGLIIYGGIIWMTGEGNEEKATKAKNIITGSITGLIIVMLAYAISYFLIQYFSEQTLN